MASLLIPPPLPGGQTAGEGKSDVGVYVTVGVVFPGMEPDGAALVEALKTLRRDDVLFQCANINTLVSGHGDFDTRGRQQRMLWRFCTVEQIDRINAFARDIRSPGPPAVFFRGQMLELMRWAARHCDKRPGDGHSFDAPAVRTRFFKAALIASDVWGRRVFRNRLSADGDVDDVRRSALAAVRKGVEEANLSPHLGIAIGRGRALFNDYVPAVYPAFAEMFGRATGMTVDEYFICATALSTFTLANREDGPAFNYETVASATARPDLFSRFLSLESQRLDDLEGALWEGFDKSGYLGLRNRPIMFDSNGRGVILDPTFFYEKLSIGPLFYAVEQAKKGRRGEVNAVFAAFGKAFENYAADVLRRMYPSRLGLVDRATFSQCGRDKEGRNFEVDAIMAGVSETSMKSVVFEIKAAWLREEAVLSDLDEAFVAEVRSKYGASSAKGERDKGVAQLARSVGAIVRGEWAAKNGEFAGATVFYPVLLVHDARMDAPVIGNFLNGDFMALLGSVPVGKRVAPLTIMTMKDLENLESSVGEFSFLDLLTAYDCECGDRLRSLHNFLALSGYADRINPNAYLFGRTEELSGRMMRELFPRAPDADDPATGA